MSQFVAAISAGIVATVLIGSTFDPLLAEAKMSKIDKELLKQTTISCKAQVKARKLGWFARRKFFKSCMTLTELDHSISIHLLD